MGGTRGQDLFTVDDEIELIQRQAALQSSLFPLEAIPNRYIGGGTPSSIDMYQLERYCKLLEELFPYEQFGFPTEYTIEANPRDISPQFLSLVKSKGINRLSLGIQSLSDRDLQWLGRESSSEIIFRALDLIEKQWEGRLSFDIIAGIPGQEDGSVQGLIDLASKMGVGHLSIYQLTVEAGTPLSEAIKNGLRVAPGDKEYQEGFKKAAKSAADGGYHRYEVSSFSRPGEESLHNLTYWRGGSSIGLGRGAVGTLYAPDAPMERAIRFSGSPEGTIEQEELDSGQLLTEYLMTRFRLTGNQAGVKLPGPEMEKKLAPVLRRYIDQGLLICSTSLRGVNLYQLSDCGLDILDTFLIDLLRELDRYHLS